MTLLISPLARLKNGFVGNEQLGVSQPTSPHWPQIESSDSFLAN
jgi:hypothetical protein